MGFASNEFIEKIKNKASFSAHFLFNEDQNQLYNTFSTQLKWYKGESKIVSMINPNAKDDKGEKAFIPLSTLCEEYWPWDIDLAIQATE